MRHILIASAAYSYILPPLAGDRVLLSIHKEYPTLSTLGSKQLLGPSITSIGAVDV